MKPILVYQTAFLGDLFLSLPLLLNIKKNYSNHPLYLVCRKGCGAIFSELKIVDKVFEVDKSNKEQYAEIVQELKSNEFEFIFSPHYSFRTQWIVHNLKSKYKVGFSNFWNFFIFNHRIKRDLGLPDALRQLQLLSLFDDSIKSEIQNYKNQKQSYKKIDLSNLNSRPEVPEIASMNILRNVQNYSLYQSIFEKFKLKEPYVFLAPGSVWGTKRWTPDGYSQVANYLKNNFYVYLIGAPQEKDLCLSIEKELNHPKVISFASKPSLLELFVLMSKAQLVVCNDSGSMHMASALNIPTVSIFGPTVLEIGYQPWQNKAIVVENNSIDCRPCGKHGPQVCPKGHHLCMKSISSEKVVESIQKVLN